jgi:hypothetical protein
MPLLMATILFLWPILKHPMANIPPPYGAIIFAMAKIVRVVEQVWCKLFYYGDYLLRRSKTHAETLSNVDVVQGRDGEVFSRAFSCCRWDALNIFWRSLNAKRANREAESGLRCSSAVKYLFNGSITALMNSNNRPASFCLSSPSIEVATDCRPAESWQRRNNERSPGAR